MVGNGKTTGIVYKLGTINENQILGKPVTLGEYCENRLIAPVNVQGASLLVSRIEDNRQQSE